MSATSFVLCMLTVSSILLEVVIVPVEERILRVKAWGQMSPRERHGQVLVLLIGIAFIASLTLDYFA